VKEKKRIGELSYVLSMKLKAKIYLLAQLLPIGLQDDNITIIDHISNHGVAFNLQSIYLPRY
jgi:hypothetical protein